MIAMIRRGLAYGWLATRRRMRSLLLPMLTVATGSFLFVWVLILTQTVRAQASQLGDQAEVVRATVLIAVVVLLVGVVEVAVCTTRSIVARSRELGVLGATGVGRQSVVAALLVEPVMAAAIGSALGGAVAIAAAYLLAAMGALDASPVASTALLAGALSCGVSAVTALVTSVVPSWRAASRPPVRSLHSGG